MLKKIKNKKGFTLIELIVVIAIISVLAAIIIPSVSANITRANEARDLANARAYYAEASIEVLLDEADATGTDEPIGECEYSFANNAITAFECVMDTGTYTLVNGQITAP